MTNRNAKGAIPKSVTIRGVTFPTVNAAAKAYGLHPGTLGRRLRDGWDIEEAIGYKKHRKKMPGRRLRYAGKMYPSIKALAQEIGVQPSALQARLARGLSVKDVVEFKPVPITGNRKAVMFQGRRYVSGTALAAKFGLTWSIVSRRLNRGWTMKQALGIDPSPPRFRDFEGHARRQHWKEVQIIDGRRLPKASQGEYRLYVIRNVRNGKEYVGITTNALDVRLSGHFALAKKGRKSHLYNAMRHYGRNAFEIELVRSDAKDFAELQRQEVREIERRNSIQKGYNTALGGSLGTSKSIQIGTQRFVSRNAAAEHFGIDVTVFNLRLGRLGWTPEEAAEIAPRRKYSRRKVSVAGKSFPSLKAAAEAHGLDCKLVHDRVSSKGWTVPQALEVDPPPDTVIYRGKSIRMKGMTYSSISKAAKAFGLEAEALGHRIRKGDSPDEALRRCLAVRKGTASYHIRRQK